MARRRIYATEEERQAAKKASWQKYNLAHKSERAAHNKVYCQRADVKAKRREHNKMYCQREDVKARSHELYIAKQPETANSTKRD